MNKNVTIYGKVRWVDSQYPKPSGSKKLQQEKITYKEDGGLLVEWVWVETVHEHILEK